MFRAYGTLPPLTKRYHEHPIQYGDRDDMSVQGFYPPGHKYLGWEAIPPDNKLKNGRRSFMAPISHIHLLQDEVFTVTQGEGLWHMRGHPPHHLKAGDSITIPKCIAHRFENLPGSTGPLVIDYNYNSSMREMEIRFFTNALSYLDDCGRADMPPSSFQLCVFLVGAWMMVDLQIPGSKWVNLVLSTLYTYVLAAIGYFVLGYQQSYPEYYREDSLLFAKKTL